DVARRIRAGVAPSWGRARGAALIEEVAEIEVLEPRDRRWGRAGRLRDGDAQGRGLRRRGSGGESLAIHLRVLVRAARAGEIAWVLRFQSLPDYAKTTRGRIGNLPPTREGGVKQ